MSGICNQADDRRKTRDNSRQALKVGAYYFFVTHEDRDLTIPVIEILRFKSDVPGGESGKMLFLFERVGEHEPLNCRRTEDLLETSLFDFDGLICELKANRDAQTRARAVSVNGRAVAGVLIAAFAVIITSGVASRMSL